MRIGLLLVGAGCELIGIILVGSPDLLPGAIGAAGWARIRWRAFANRMRRLLRLPIHATVYAETATATGTASVGGTSTISFSPEAALTDQVAFILSRDLEVQKAMSGLDERLSTIEAEAPKRLAELREEMQTHVSRQLTEAMEDKRAARIWGACALAIGLALTTVANFL